MKTTTKKITLSLEVRKGLYQYHCAKNPKGQRALTIVHIDLISLGEQVRGSRHHGLVELEIVRNTE